MNAEPSATAHRGLRLQAVYFDLDGTLLDDDREIPVRAAEKLRRLQADGVRVGVATGRMYASARRYVEAIRSNAPLIIYNGARIVEPATGSVLTETVLPASHAAKGLAVARRLGVHVNLYVGSELYMDSRDRLGQLFLEKENLRASYTADLREVLDRDPVKILFIGEPEVLKDCRQEIARATGNRVTLVFSEPDYLEMLPMGISKGRALARACQLMKIDLARVAAFGDAPNDAEMLEMAGMGVAMENAAQAAKEAARMITGPNHGDGVVDALEKLFPGQ